MVCYGVYKYPGIRWPFQRQDLQPHTIQPIIQLHPVVPTMARQWILNSQEGFEVSLEYQEHVNIPSADELGPNEVLVQLHAASLNYREIVIAGPGVS
jgi:hypothetical protein